MRNVSRAKLELSEPLKELLRVFKKLKIQVAIIISEFDGTLSMVTFEDILEEFVGDIQDEHDHEIQIVTRSGDTFRVLATSYLYDINKFLDHPIKVWEEYETLAGLLMHHSPSNLKEGDELVLEGYRMKVLGKCRNLPEFVEMQFIGTKEEAGSDDRAGTLI